MEKKTLTIGCRIPQNYFETKGNGSSDITKHAGSMHLALKEAGIEMGNIMTYSSILPKIAKLIEKPTEITHGCVIESIMAICHGNRNQICTAGIIYGWLYDKITGEKFGGLVCEHADNVSNEDIINRLYLSLDELYYNGFSEKYDLRDKHHITESYIGNKIHNTALVALCFVDYVVPIL
jgi:arginine decarboxylase